MKIDKKINRNKGFKFFLKERGGQALAEILISLGIGAIVLSSVAGVMRISALSNKGIKESKSAYYLAQEEIDNARAYADSRWSNFYQLSKGSSNQYYISTSTTPFSPVSGSEEISLDLITYTRYFYVENVSRDNSDDSVVSSGGTEDPLTQKVTSKVTWGGTGEAVLVEYISNVRNFVIVQSDWSGGVGSDGPFSVPGSAFSSSSNVSTTTQESIQLLSNSESGYLISSIFDTGFATTVPNTIIWQGTQPTGTSVKFQISTSSSADGPWTYIGTDGTASTYYEPSAGTQVKVVGGNHLFQRYIRYKVYLYPDGGNSATPNITDIIINYTR